MSTQPFDEFWNVGSDWSIDKVCWTKGVRRQIKEMICDSGPFGVTPTQIARTAKWTTHDAMCLIEYLVSVGAVKRRFSPIRRYAIDPSYKGNVWMLYFS